MSIGCEIRIEMTVEGLVRKQHLIMRIKRLMLLFTEMPECSDISFSMPLNGLLLNKSLVFNSREKGGGGATVC